MRRSNSAKGTAMPLYRIKKRRWRGLGHRCASSGIGRELVLQMAREGYTVAATARSADKLDEMVAEAAGWRGTIVAYPCDVTDRNAMQATVRQIAAETGPIRLAVFNAGSYCPTYGDAIDLDRFRDNYETQPFRRAERPGTGRGADARGRLRPGGFRWFGQRLFRIAGGVRLWCIEGRAQQYGRVPAFRLSRR